MTLHRTPSAMEEPITDNQRLVVSRVTIAAAQAAGDMPNHWIVKLEMTNGYVRMIAVGSYEAAAAYLQILPNEYEMGGFIEP